MKAHHNDEWISVMSLEKCRKQIESVKQEETQLSLVFFAIGIAIGYCFTLMFEPLLKLVLHWHIINAILVAGFIALLIFLISVLSRVNAWLPDFSFERALKLFFLGVSATSFFFALYNFVRFPDLIFAGGRPWITYGKDYVFPLGGNYAVRLSDIIYFIAKTLWSIFIGSLFAVLDRFWKVI